MHQATRPMRPPGMLQIDMNALVVTANQLSCVQVCGLIGGCNGIINTGDNFYGEAPDQP